MPVVHLSGHGSFVHVVGEVLVVRKGKEVVGEVPLLKVDQVQVWGRGVTLTTGVLAALAARKVGVFYMAGGGEGKRFELAWEGGVDGALQLEQARFVDDPGRSLAMAKLIVAGKLENQRALLAHLQGVAPGPMQKAVGGIEAMAGRVAATSDVDVLRGLEGQAAVAYWSGFRALLRGNWGFERREFRPPPDPLNALLSFGYTMLQNEVTMAVRGRGLHPQWGVFHVVDHGRPSLALDLMEEWRPVIVDALVLGLVNRGVVTPADFERRAVAVEGNGASQGVWLAKEARRRVVEAFEQRVQERAVSPITGNEESFRQMFRLQAEEFARAVMAEGGVSYRPYMG